MPSKQLEGFEKLSRQLSQLAKDADPKQIRSAVGFALTPVVRAAKQRAPVGDTAHKTHKGRLVAPGFLSRNIRKRTRLSRDKKSAIGSVGPSSEAFYGTQFVEVGTSNQSAQPWLEPAYNASKSEAVSRFISKLLEKVEKTARK